MTDFHIVAREGTPIDHTDRLLASLAHWREENTTAALRRGAADLRIIDASRTVVDQAKGALMLRYGIGSHQAFAVLVRWSQETASDLPTLAHTLVHEVCPGTEAAPTRHPALAHWLEAHLRDDLADDAVPRQRRQRDRSAPGYRNN